MSTEFVSVSDLTEPPKSFDDAVAELLEEIKADEIPSWLLIPKRKSGEHATGGAWRGVVMAECYKAQDNGEEEATINARIAWDTEDRGRGKSSPEDVPDVFLDVILETAEDLDGVEMCVARITFDAETMEATDIEVGHRVAAVSEE